MTSISTLWGKYQGALQRYPLQTKALTASFTQAMSDLIAQRLSNVKPMQWKRTCLMMIFGLVWVGPSMHYWHKFVENVVFRTLRTSSLGTVLLKAVFDQLTYGPIANLTLMAYLTLVVEKQKLETYLVKVRDVYPGLQLKGWKLWPLASIINYRFIQLRYRVLFMNIVGVFWTTFLNLQARRRTKLMNHD